MANRGAYDGCMDSFPQPPATNLSAQDSSTRARIEQLAAIAGVAPETLWAEVAQFGIDDVEQSILADLEGQLVFEQNLGTEHREVHAQAQAIIFASGRPQKNPLVFE